jgi:hypothetical protein
MPADKKDEAKPAGSIFGGVGTLVGGGSASTQAASASGGFGLGLSSISANPPASLDKPGAEEEPKAPKTSAKPSLIGQGAQPTISSSFFA